MADGTPPTVDNNNDDFMVEVAKGVKLKINVTPDNVFNQGLFDTLQQIEDELANPIGNLDNLLSQLDGHLNDVLAERAELGARVNRLELVEQRLSEQQLIAKRMISDNEDADIEKLLQN